MGDFFHRWRRKLGCVTLMIVLTVSGVWLRSFSTNDQINIWSGPRTIHSLDSSPMGLTWMKRSKLPPNIPMLSGRFGMIAFQTFPRGVCDPFQWSTARYRIRCFGFDFAEAAINPPDSGELTIWNVPHWSIVLPLTLLSTYLILRPGKRPAKNVDHQGVENRSAPSTSKW